jgi:hypothetical protein
VIQVRISEDMLADGISVWISRKPGEMPRQVLHVAEGGRWTEWADLDPHETGDVDPTIRLDDDLGRALLDALLRHYQGSGDYHTLRADYLHERGRVDRMIGVLDNAVNKAVSR